ncbi:MAG: gliding motility-associated C-terminal domain-containing protein [Bacteroidota bacterium]
MKNNRFIQTVVLFFCLLSNVFAQTVIFTENFNSAPNWTLNSPGNSIISGSLPTPGGTPNTWAINAAGTNIDGTNNLHITCSGFICNILGAPGPVYNASSAANNTNTAATMNADILASSFTGSGPFTLTFQWICDGATTPSNGSARLIYSVNGGVSWLEHPTNYNANPGGPITESINMSTLTGFNPGVDNIRLGFRWFNIGTTGHNDPPMIVDNINITTPSASNTITTGIITGSPFCAGATLNIPFTSTGTFNAGNVYTAQLSDAAGSFASPTVIGTLNSTANSGTIAATIPGGTPTGTGYLIRVIASNPSINGSSSVAFTINAPVTPTFTAIPNVCQNATAPTLPTTSNNGVDGTWAPPVSTATPGTTNYTFTPNAGQCANTATLSITVDALVTPTFTAIPNVCQNATAPILSATSNNGINGTWAPPVSTATPGTTNYTFTPNAGQCANTAALSITVDAPVMPTFAQIGPLCVGSVAPSLPLSSTNTPAINGTWSPSTINTAAVGTATYTFTPDAGQCATPATMSIEITNSITPTFSAIGPVCQGSPTVLLPQNSTNVPPISGSWTPFMSINTTNAGTTTYTFTPNAGQCASLYNVDIIVTPPTVTPTFNAIGPLCIGAVPPALPLFSTNTPAVVGTWSPAVINTSVAGTSTYTFTPDGGQCAVPTTIDITVTSSITPTFALIGPLCIGSAAPILPAASTNVPAITGTWSPAAINTAVPGTTTYSFTADPNQCATNTSMDIVVTNNITATFNNIPPVCQGVTAPSLPAISTNNPPITGTWNPAVINTGTVGISTYTFTPDPGQCAGNVSLDVEVVPTPPSPSISITASVTTICAGENVNFTASPNSSNTGDVIQWFVNGTAVIGGTGLLFSSNTLNNNDQITAVFTPSSSCLAGQTATSNLIVITVNPVVTPVVNITASATQICTGENVTFTSTITGGGTNPQYQWFINGNAVAGATNATFATSNFQNADNVTLQLISNQPCASPTTVISNIVTMSVTNLATPTVSISADKNIICESQQVVFTATANFGGTSPQYIWQVGNNTFTTTDAQFTATGITSNTNVTCTLVSNFLCTTSDTALSNSLNIQVNPIPTVVLSNDVTIQQGESTTLTATTAANLTYLWTPSTALSCTDCTVTEANPEESTTYTFTVTDPATNCSAADSVVVTVIRTFDVWVPNAFSPNKDGVNDIFFVRGNNVKDFALKIFDRWGTLMFETSNLNDGWNGEYQGRIVNTGIFVYTLDYTLKEGTQGTLKGNISVSN